MATFERIHKKLLEFCSTDSQDCPVSERILTEYIEQLLLKDEDTMPPEFLSQLEMKINVLPTLKLKIEKDSQLSEDIDQLWVRWLKKLFSKEESEEKERFTRKTVITPIHKQIQDASLYQRDSPLIPIRESPSLSQFVTQASDQVITYFEIPIYKDRFSGERSGVFRFGKKQSDKYICSTLDCGVPPSKQFRIQISGVTLQTLRCHARKHHHIHLEVKQNRGYAMAPISCQYCCKTFIREQILREHIRKFHNASPV